MASNQPPVKRTYSSKAARARGSFVSSASSSVWPSSDTLLETTDDQSRSDEDSTPTDSPQRVDSKRKREVDDDDTPPAASLFDNSLFNIQKRRRTAPLLPAAKVKKENLISTASSKKLTGAQKSKYRASGLTQLHLSFTSGITTCSLCGLAYTRGAIDDEQLHKSHCARATRGLEWGKEEEKAAGVQVVEDQVRLKDGRRGRIVYFRSDIKGRLRAKLTTLLETVNVALSAPALPPESLAQSKFYVFLLPVGVKEKIIGCVVATRIKTAMRIVPKNALGESGEANRDREAELVCVDGDESGIFCDPKPLSATLGIPLSSCLQIQKAQMSTAAALARKPIEAPGKWKLPEPTPDRQWRRSDFVPRSSEDPRRNPWAKSTPPRLQPSTSTRPRPSPTATNKLPDPKPKFSTPTGMEVQDKLSEDGERGLRRFKSRRGEKRRDLRYDTKEAEILINKTSLRRDASTSDDPLERALQLLDRVVVKDSQKAAQNTAVQAKQSKKKAAARAKEAQTNSVFIPTAISVGNLARLLNVTQERVQGIMEGLELGHTSYDRVLKADDASLIAMELNYNPVVDDVAAFDIYPEPQPTDKSKLPMRPPIVTIMGHVDHGKTTLLDTLRSASVAAGESGGITQHIGAFSVPLRSLSVSTSSSASSSKSVTFLDTPGHAAFSAMRARGANVTDIIVLVVAADDGVMPQTKEVIQLAQKDPNVQLIVAINKCDKPGVDVDEIKHGLLSEGVELEEFGGEVPSVEVSGLTGLGLDKLMETIITVAEVSDLRAEKDIRAHGHVLEARMDKGRGPIATVLVSRGTLKRGDSIAAGITWAKVRQMTDDKGKPVDSAGPGTPVTVAGWKELPVAGDEVLAAIGRNASDDAKRASLNRIRQRDAAALMDDVQCINEKRRQEKERRDEILANTTVAKFNRSGIRVSGSKSNEAVLPVSAYAQKDDAEGPKELKLVVKGDVSGSVEAFVGAISGIGNKDARVCVIHSGVGDVTDSDVTLAATAQGKFPLLSFRQFILVAQASQSGVSIHVDSVIYRLIDDVTARVCAMLPRIIETKVVGEATVQQLFTLKKGKGSFNVAGCRVVNGSLEKHKTARVVRNGETIAQGKLEQMRHIKTEVAEVRKGMECGLTLDTFGDFQAGDLIQAYTTIELPATL
ncbi:hypothetical protein FRB99_005918 [Tulasnella sp. 403]|nr:hypothetical protein FRB99_005918 [Tulasnella sp. 403]